MRSLEPRRPITIALVFAATATYLLAAILWGVNDSFLLLLNSHWEPARFRLPGPAYGERWTALVDTADPEGVPDETERKAGTALTVTPRGLVLLSRPSPAEGVRRPPPPAAGGTYVSKHQLLLSMRLDESSWVLHAMSFWHAIGEVRMDMSLAVPEDKQLTVVLQGIHHGTVPTAVGAATEGTESRFGFGP